MPGTNCPCCLATDMAERNDHELDLPLLSNSDEINIYHYILDLTCHFDKKQFQGTITLFCKPASSESNNILEGKETDLSPLDHVEKVEEFSGSAENSKLVNYEYNNVLESEETDLSPLDHVEQVEEASKSAENLNENGTVEEFKMVLDGWDLDVEKVEEMKLLNDLGNQADHNYSSDEFYNNCLKCSECEALRLEMETDRQFVKIWKKGVKRAQDFPDVVKITYKTHPKGHSLKWTQDQDGRECVFTHGHWINNRSLFPSQDVPVAMATWQAVIHVPDRVVVLMSGDKNPVVTPCTYTPDWLSYYYFTKLEMPSSTVALAVGHWKQTDIVKDKNICTVSDDCQIPVSGDTVLPCRLFSPSRHLELARTLIGQYMPRCMEAASQLLGPHPFKRLDILVVPSSFCSLGMASPSLMFISQSLLSADQEMCIRLAHELSHSWFGLIIGPRDWTEEWLSEGFCTYTEGYIHGIVMQWSDREKKEQMEIRDYLKYKTLKAESLSTQTELQTLRPNKGESTYKDGETKYVVNGMNPEKSFIQVHYLKGYFLLQHLEEQVGIDRFQEFLRLFIHKFYGKLVLSQNFLSLYFETFPFLRERGVTENLIYSEWLDRPGLAMRKDLSVSHNSLVREALPQFQKISTLNKKYISLHWRKKRKLDITSCLKLKQLKGVQELLLLDYLLEEERIHTDILDHLQQFYNLGMANADIQHKWCELVVKSKSQQHYADVKKFLINEQAMGVYLFGELILSGDKEQRKLAEDTFELIADSMEDGVYKTVHLMVFGT